MMDDKQSVVGLIRGRTEEEDLDKILKSNMGGYTKKSVADYVNGIKKEQQKATVTFNKNMQSVLDEKEKLAAKIDSLNEKLTKKEAEYCSLSDVVNSFGGEAADNLSQSVTELIAKNSVLEQDKTDLSAKLMSEEVEQKRLKAALDDKTSQLETANKSIQVHKAGQAETQKEVDAARKEIATLTNTMDKLRKENDFLNEMVSEGRIAKLNEEIENLKRDVQKVSVILSKKERENESLNNFVSSMTEESATVSRANDKLRQVNDDTMLQNEKLLEANKLLVEQLKGAYSELVEAYAQKSDIAVEKAMLMRKLDSANVKLAAAEYRKDTDVKQEI